MLAKRIIPCLDVTAGRVVKGVNFTGLRDAGDPVEVAARYNEQELGLAPGIRVQRRAWFNPNLDSGWHLLPGLIASLSMIQTMLLAALGVAREREQGTFDQLLVTPLTPLQILIGKALPSMLVGLLQSSLVLLIIRFWFQVPMAGPLWLLYLGLLAFNAATVGVGLSVSALSLTMQQAMLTTSCSSCP